MSNVCCPTDVKPAVNDYKGVGKRVKIGDLNAYVTGSATQAIMLVYDVFGWTPNAEQVADALAAAGFVVIIPDFYNGDPWPYTNIPPSKDGAFPKGVAPADGTDVLIDWIINSDACKTERSVEVKAAKDYLVAEYKITKMGAVGMCWGAKLAWVTQNTTPGLVDAVAACHGSFLNKDDIEATKVPMCLLNSKEEPPEYDADLKPILEGRPKCVYKNYPTMHHGWMGTRGISSVTDFEKEEVAKKWQEAITDLVNFFKTAME